MGIYQKLATNTRYLSVEVLKFKGEFDMGLDIYVRWGSVDDDGYHDKFDTEFKTHHELQLTGFRSAPESGYLRESWGSLEWVSDWGNRFGSPQIYSFYKDWNGSNGESLTVCGSTITRLVEFRESLREWAAIAKKNRDELIDIAAKHASGECRAEVKRNAYEIYSVYIQRVRDVIGFLQFVELNKDRENLAIIFG